jgi:hypothetical protein
MLRKRFIFENDEEKDVDEMSDYEKIMRLAKKRLRAQDVYFENSEGEDFSNVIEINNDGIMFTFDGLEEFLKFFFPQDYGESYDEYAAGYLESMYNGNWDFYSDFSDRDSEDWSEGYISQRFKKNHLEIIRDIAKFLSISLYDKISKTLENGESVSDSLNKEIADFLEVLDISDEIISTHTEASVYATEDAVKKGIQDTYCDCLRNVGVERYSQKYCFWKYEMDWGSCLMLFARFGTDEDNFLDLLFSSISKEKISHLPEYYEVQYNYWDDQKFNEVWDEGVTKILENKLENILENIEDYNEKYFETLNKVTSLGGIDKWIKTKDGKYEIKIISIDPQTALITYNIKKDREWRSKVGKTDIDSLMSLIYNEKLFDVMEHIEKFSILRNKTFL